MRNWLYGRRKLRAISGKAPRLFLSVEGMRRAMRSLSPLVCPSIECCSELQGSKHALLVLWNYPPEKRSFHALCERAELSPKGAVVQQKSRIRAISLFDCQETLEGALYINMSKAKLFPARPLPAFVFFHHLALGLVSLPSHARTDHCTD